MIMLDNSAGTKPYPEVAETITGVLMNYWGNSSSNNSFGLEARKIIDRVTQQVADDINCEASEIIWTSGACEANSLAITGVLGMNSYMHLLTSKLEHTSINELVKNLNGHPVAFIDNTLAGFIDYYDLENKLKDLYNRGCKMLVSISAANSEIGVIQDIKRLSDIVHQYGGILHVDATQLFPWCQVNVKALGIDLMSISGQKMHCVKGIGFLYVRNGIKIKPMIYGSQQDGRRAGTMPTHLIAAFGHALKITRENECETNNRVSDMRDKLLNKLLSIRDVHVVGSLLYRLPNNISVIIDGVNAEKLTTLCDLLGIIIAKGSACQAYNSEPSKTLKAIGLTDEQAFNTIRISLDQFNTDEDIDTAADVITKLITRIREENI